MLREKHAVSIEGNQTRAQAQIRDQFARHRGPILRVGHVESGSILSLKAVGGEYSSTSIHREIRRTSRIDDDRFPLTSSDPNHFTEQTRGQYALVDIAHQHPIGDVEFATEPGQKLLLSPSVQPRRIFTVDA